MDRRHLRGGRSRLRLTLNHDHGTDQSLTCGYMYCAYQIEIACLRITPTSICEYCTMSYRHPCLTLPRLLAQSLIYPPYTHNGQRDPASFHQKPVYHKERSPRRHTPRCSFPDHPFVRRLLDLSLTVVKGELYADPFITRGVGMQLQRVKIRQSLA